MAKKILLADDSVTIQKVVRNILADGGFKLTTVDNGDDALKKAREIIPDLILADLVMPGKDGYEVCKEVKNDPSLKNIPVLLLAGSFDAFDETKSAQVGADGHITKPFDSPTLLHAVNSLLEKGAGPKKK